MSSGSIATLGAEDTNRRRELPRLAIYALAAFLCLLAVIRYRFHAETLAVVFAIAVLVEISRHDLERHVIPNRIVVPAWLAVLVAQLAIYPHHWVEWIGASLGAGAFFFVFVVAYPAGLGMGDVKLALLLGAVLGWSVISALLLGTFAAGLFAGVMLARQGSAARKQAIPLGPFLAAGAIVVLLFF